MVPGSQVLNCNFGKFTPKSAFESWSIDFSSKKMFVWQVKILGCLVSDEAVARL